MKHSKENNVEERRWIKVQVPLVSYGPVSWPFEGFVGIPLPVMDDEAVARIPAGLWHGPDVRHPAYFVELCEAIVSLQAAGQERVALFWQAVVDWGHPIHYLRVAYEDCVVVEGPGLSADQTAASSALSRYQRQNT